MFSSSASFSRNFWLTPFSMEVKKDARCLCFMSLKPFARFSSCLYSMRLRWKEQQENRHKPDTMNLWVFKRRGNYCFEAKNHHRVHQDPNFKSLTIPKFKHQWTNFQFRDLTCYILSILTTKVIGWKYTNWLVPEITQKWKLNCQTIERKNKYE